MQKQRLFWVKIDIKLHKHRKKHAFFAIISIKNQRFVTYLLTTDTPVLFDIS